MNEMKFDYGYRIQEAYDEEERNLEERLKTAKTIAGTQKFMLSSLFLKLLFKYVDSALRPCHTLTI